MGMSSHVEGFRPPDEEWRKMKAVWDACRLAGVTPPTEVATYFKYGPPDEAGIKVDLGEDEGAKDYQNDYCSGIEVDLSKMPANLTVLRFLNCW